MKTKEHPSVGKKCINCGHVIYNTKRFGLRCWCDNPKPEHSINLLK